MPPVTQQQLDSVRAEIEALGSRRIEVRNVSAKDDSDAEGDAVLVTVVLAPSKASSSLDADEFLRIRREARAIATRGFVDKDVRVVYETSSDLEAPDAPVVQGGDKHSGSETD